MVETIPAMRGTLVELSVFVKDIFDSLEPDGIKEDVDDTRGEGEEDTDEVAIEEGNEVVADKVDVEFENTGSSVPEQTTFGSRKFTIKVN